MPELKRPGVLDITDHAIESSDEYGGQYEDVFWPSTVCAVRGQDGSMALQWKPAVPEPAPVTAHLQCEIIEQPLFIERDA